MELRDTSFKAIDYTVLSARLKPIRKLEVKRVYKILHSYNEIFGNLNRDLLKDLMALQGLRDYCASKYKDLDPNSIKFMTDYTNNLSITFSNEEQRVALFFDFAFDGGQPISVYVRGKDSSYHKVWDPTVLYDLKILVPRRARIRHYFINTEFLKDYILWYKHEYIYSRQQ